MRIRVNGEVFDLATGSTLADAVEGVRAAPERRGLAAALDGEVIPRSEWTRTVLTDGARVELVVAVQGG